jgi:hypothetical protein
MSFGGEVIDFGELPDHEVDWELEQMRIDALERPTICYGCGEDFAVRHLRFCRACSDRGVNCPQCSGGGIKVFRSGEQERCGACRGKGSVSAEEYEAILEGPVVWSN